MFARRGVLRILLAGVAAVLAVTGLAGCRTSPTVAAYVGDGSVSIAQLDRAVAAREDADPAVAAYAKGHRAAFTRQVLGLLVTQQVYEEVSRRYDVQVADDAVRARIAQLLSGNDPEQVYGQLAAQGIGRADVFENVRQQLVRQQVAAKAGLADSLSDSALQARYQQVRGTLGQKQFGYITVPEQATADSILAQLTANPSSYPTLAAQHPGSYTQPTLQPTSAAQIPSPFATGVASAAPNTGFVQSVPQVGVVVVFVGQTVYPTFEEVRSQLEQEAASGIDTQAQKLVAKVRTGMHVTVNPRYGVLKNGSISEPTGGVVDILGASGSSPASGAAATSTPAG